MPRKPVYSSPQEAETAFYEALERCDLDAMMAVWSEDEDIVCIQPGGDRFSGYAPVRDAWRRVFENGARLRVHLLALTTVQGPFTAVHSVIEQISLPGRKQMAAPVAATNVYVRGALGWRMVVHHASPVSPASIGDAPQILH